MPEKIVSAVVKAKEDVSEEDGAFDSKVSLDIASFNSQYPTPVYVKDEGIYNSLKKGGTYKVRLEQGKLGDGKDGSKLWHYRWKFLGLADGHTPEAAPQPAQASPNGSIEPQEQLDPHEIGMRRAVALKAVAEMVSAGKLQVATFGEWFYYLCNLMGEDGSLETPHALFQDDSPEAPAATQAPKPVVKQPQAATSVPARSTGQAVTVMSASGRITLTGEAADLSREFGATTTALGWDNESRSAIVGQFGKAHWGDLTIEQMRDAIGALRAKWEKFKASMVPPEEERTQEKGPHADLPF